LSAKDEVFQLRISDEDRRRMQLLAQRWGVSMAGAVRMLLRQAVSQAELDDLRRSEDDEEEADDLEGHSGPSGVNEQAEDDAWAAHADKILADVRRGKVKRLSEAEVDAKLLAAGLLDG
jgi:hypothetical protein